MVGERGKIPNFLGQWARSFFREISNFNFPQGGGPFPGDSKSWGGFFQNTKKPPGNPPFGEGAAKKRISPKMVSPPREFFVRGEKPPLFFEEPGVAPEKNFSPVGENYSTHEEGVSSSREEKLLVVTTHKSSGRGDVFLLGERPHRGNLGPKEVRVYRRD